MKKESGKIIYSPSDLIRFFGIAVRVMAGPLQFRKSWGDQTGWLFHQL
jgi:hypothetical protein